MIARNPFRPVKTVLVTVALAAVLSACSAGKWGFPYKADIQQGNWITSEQVALLQNGMTREQVRFALGSPTLTSVLHGDRWDYPYYFKPGYGKPEERQFTVWFENDRLVKWSGDEQPALQPFQINTPDASAIKKDDKDDAREAKREEEEDKASRGPVINSPSPSVTEYPGRPGSTPEPIK